MADVTVTTLDIRSGSRTLSVNDAGHGEALIDLVDDCGSGLAIRLKPGQVLDLRAALGERIDYGLAASMRRRA